MKKIFKIKKVIFLEKNFYEKLGEFVIQRIVKIFINTNRFKICAIFGLFLLISCDPPKNYLLNNKKYYDEIFCNDKKTFIFISGSLMINTSSITFKSKENLKFNKLYINNNEIKFEVSKYEDYFHINFKHNYNNGDSILIYFDVNNCNFKNEYIIGNLKNVSSIFIKDRIKLEY